MTPLSDQSIFVRGAVQGVIREAIIAAALTAHHDPALPWQLAFDDIIAISIPLSILTSVIALSALGETINTMTLGGLALAVGILVDDATVTIENIERLLEEGHPMREAILEGAAQISVPALVSTLCICIVFLPMFFLGGVARYLFVPLAEAVVFAMLASYILSRTLVPTMAMYLLRHRTTPPTGIFVRFQRGFERSLRACSRLLSGLLVTLIESRRLFVPLLHRHLPLHVHPDCHFSDRTSSPTPIAASSSFMSAEPPACVSKRPRVSSISSKTRSAKQFPLTKSITSSTTSACRTAQ